MSLSATDARTSSARLLEASASSSPAAATETVPMLQRASLALGNYQDTMAKLGRTAYLTTCRVTSWFVAGSTLTAGGSLALHGHSLSACLAGMLAASLGSAIVGVVARNISEVFTGRSLGVASVRAFDVPTGTEFERAVIGELAHYALDRAIDENAVGEEAIALLRRAADDAESLPRDIQISAQRFVDVILGIHDPEATPSMRGAEIEEALATMTPEERVSANAFVRAAVLTVPSDVLTRSAWAQLYEATRPEAPELPAATGARVVNSGAVAGWQKAIALFAEAEATSTAAATAERSPREVMVNDVLLPTVYWGAVIGAFFGEGGIAALATALYGDDLRQFIADKVTKQERRSWQNGPELAVVEKAAGLDCNNPLERAILVTLAERWLQALEDNDGGSVSLRDALHAVVDGYTVDQAGRDEARVLINVLEAVAKDDYSEVRSELGNLAADVREAVRRKLVRDLVSSKASTSNDRWRTLRLVLAG